MRYLVQLNADVANTYMFAYPVGKETDKCYYFYDADGHERRIRKAEIGISTRYDDGGTAWFRTYAVGMSEAEARDQAYALAESEMYKRLEQLRDERNMRVAS